MGLYKPPYSNMNDFMQLTTHFEVEQLYSTGQAVAPHSDMGSFSGTVITQCCTSRTQKSNAGLVSPLARGVSFVKQHREELRNRMGAIYPILARLRDIEAMNSDEEEEVLSMRNRRKVMNDALLQLVERKGAQAQEELYQSLKDTDPYLVQDLEQSS